MRFHRFSTTLPLCGVVLITATSVLTGAQAATRSGHCSTANGLIAFGADATGNYQLYTVRPNGSHLTQLTHTTGKDSENPDWAPDGRTLVFEVDTPTSGDVATIHADGSHRRMLHLAPTGGVAGQPSYSTDGRHLFYERYDGVSDDAIFTATANGRHSRRVTDPPDGYGDTDPNVSPDGRLLSFVRLGPHDGDAALFTIRLRTGRESQLTSYDTDVAIKQAWSPDGHRIAFTRDYYSPKPGISGNIVTVNRHGRHPVKVTHYSGGDVNGVVGSYSPDGRWIVGREARPDDASLIVVHPDGSGQKEVLDVPGLVPRFIDWGPRAR
jgi:Tol biopolymer transport system component